MRIGGKGLVEGEGTDEEPLEALAIDDFDDEDESDDDDGYEDDEDDDSDNFYTAPRLGLHIGGAQTPRTQPSEDEDVADIVEAVAADALVDGEEPPVPDATPAPPARHQGMATAATLPDVSDLEVKEVHREGSFTTEGRPLDSEVMSEEGAAFAITIERPTTGRDGAAARRNDHALPYLALITSTAGMLAGAAVTAVGLFAIASILGAMSSDAALPPDEPPPHVAAPDATAPRAVEAPVGAGEDAADEDTGDAQEEEAEDAPAPRRRRRAPVPEPEPEPVSEPEPVPVPVPEPEVAPEPEPEPEKERRGLFRKKKRKKK